MQLAEGHSGQDMSQCQSWRCNRTLFFKVCERVFPLQPLTVKCESSVVSSPSHSAFHRNMVVGVVTAPVLFSSNTWANQEAHFNLLFSPLSQTTPLPFLSRPRALCSAWSREKSNAALSSFKSKSISIAQLFLFCIMTNLLSWLSI